MAVADYHTQKGFRELQMRLWSALNALATEKGMRLMNPIWMDGTPALPTPRGPVSLTLVLSSGEQQPVTLAGAEVAAWLEGRLSEVDHQLDQALSGLKARRPR
jgi:hypothetical protein